MWRSTIAVGILVLAIGACGKDAPEGGEAAAAAAESGGDASGVEGALQTWCETQTDGDFKAYSAFYADDFEGIKRTKKGGEKTYDRKKWLRDRKKMFKNPLHVDCRAPKVEAGEGGVTSVTFEQYWRSPTYMDEGPKRIDWKETDDGLRIVHEEMISASKWDGKTFKDGTKAPRATFRLTENIKVPDMLKEMTTKEGPKCYKHCRAKKPKGYASAREDLGFDRWPKGCERYCIDRHGNFE